MADYKAKRHSVLENLKKDLEKGYLEKDVTVQGYKFKLHTLNEDEEIWADGYTRTNTPLSMITSSKAPRIAAATAAINDVPTGELFTYPDDMPENTKKALAENAIQKRYWLREQMLYFLAEDGIRPFINELYQALSALEDERSRAFEQIPN